MTESKSARATGNRGQRTSPITYYRQVVAELRKVVWPTQQQLITYFIVCVTFVVIVMTYVALLDLGLGKAAFAVFGKGS